MPFHYALHKNTIRAKGQYRAVPKNVKYVTIEDAIHELTKPGSILKETECYAVIHSLLDYINAQIEEGNGFISPYFRLTPGLRGVFESEDDQYDPERHTPSINFRAQRKMKEALSHMKVKKVDNAVRQPEVDGFEDWTTGIRHKTLTPKGAGVIWGEHLKIQDPDDPVQGVFLTHLSTWHTYRIDRILQNYPKRLLIMINDTLPPGDYSLEVRSSFNQSHDIRTGRYLKTLSVDEA